MRTIICFFLFVMAMPAQVTRLAGVRFKVADLEKARQFYTGIMGLEEAFDLKDASGAVQSVFFRVNDEQYLEFSPGAPENFQLQHVSLLTADLKAMAATLQKGGVKVGKTAKSADGNAYFTVEDPGKTEIHFVSYMPGSRQTEQRGKPAGARQVADHLQHIGIAEDSESQALALYRDTLGFREFLRGPKPDDLRWINLAMPGTPGDIIELMTQVSQSVAARQHICFEVPDIQKAYKLLLANGQPNQFKPFAAAMGRWIMFIRDPNAVRIEFMGEKTNAQVAK